MLSKRKAILLKKTMTIYSPVFWENRILKTSVRRVRLFARPLWPSAGRRPLLSAVGSGGRPFPLLVGHFVCRSSRPHPSCWTERLTSGGNGRPPCCPLEPTAGWSGCPLGNDRCGRASGHVRWMSRRRITLYRVGRLS
jgi:hypothetical protein